MKWLRTVHRALGIKAELFVLLVSALSLRYEHIRNFALDHGVDVLPNITGVVATLLFSLLVIVPPFFKRIRQLEDAIEPKISVQGPIVFTMPKGASGRARRTYRLSLTNTSATLVTNVQARLIRMVNRDGVESKEANRPFKRSLEDPPSILNASLSQSFNLPPGASEEVDIVEYDETSQGPHIRMCYALQGAKDANVYVAVPVAVCPHTLRIGVYGDNTFPVFVEFSFFVDHDGILRFERVGF